MGSSTIGMADATEKHVSCAPINQYFSANCWIEGSAIRQLNAVAQMPGVLSVAAFPDLHPGKYGPVGSAILADRIYPQLIGNDIGCGMSLFALDTLGRKVRIDKAAQKLHSLEGRWHGVESGAASKLLQQHGLAADCYAESLGTIGSGNHFCELQTVGKIFVPEIAAQAQLSADQAVLLVHSGSRAFGNSIFTPLHKFFATGLRPDCASGRDYIEKHNDAVVWASLNRQVIAQRAAAALRCDSHLISDCTHNLISQRGDDILHRKGAARADIEYVPLAGSRGMLSYLLQPSGVNSTCTGSATAESNSIAGALDSLAHGAGRKYDRASMQGRVGTTKSAREELARNPFGGRIVCEDRQLLIEEAAAAYKSISQVLDELTSAKLARAVLSLKPLVTFKKAAVKRHSKSTKKTGRTKTGRRFIARQ